MLGPRCRSGRQAAVEAAELSLEGLRAEQSIGSRQILDVLNGEQELVNARAQLVTARRNAYVAGFNLLALMGRAEARHLDFETSLLYDPMVHYDDVRDRVSLFEADSPIPQPIATGTAATPAQDAVIKTP